MQFVLFLPLTPRAIHYSPSLSGHPVSADSVLTYSHYSIIINMVYKTNLTGGRLSPKTHHNRRGASFLALQFRSLRRPFARPSLSQWIDFYLITINIHLEVDHTIRTIQCSIPFDNRDNSPFLIFPTFISPLRNFTKFRLSWLYRLPSFLNPYLSSPEQHIWWSLLADRSIGWLIDCKSIRYTDYRVRKQKLTSLIFRLQSFENCLLLFYYYAHRRPAKLSRNYEYSFLFYSLKQTEGQTDSVQHYGAEWTTRTTIYQPHSFPCVHPSTSSCFHIIETHQCFLLWDYNLLFIEKGTECDPTHPLSFCPLSLYR